MSGAADRRWHAAVAASEGANWRFWAAKGLLERIFRPVSPSPAAPITSVAEDGMRNVIRPAGRVVSNAGALL